MSQGMQVFDSGGNLQIDTSSLILTQLVVTTSSVGNYANGAISVPTPPSATVIPAAVIPSGQSNSVGTVSVSYTNNNLNYQTDGNANGNYNVKFGVFLF